MLATAILYFNKPSMTRRCLGSAQRALKRAPEAAHRTLLADNGSTNPEAIALAAGTESTSVVRLSPNRGFSAGMNAALREAISEANWVSLLSNDVELDESYFEALAKVAPEPSPVILCPQAYYLSDRSRPSYTHGRFHEAGGSLSHGFDDGRTQPIRFPEYYPAAVTVWNPAAYARLGGFDETFFCYWEDVELSYRCSKLGVELRPTPSLRIHHLGRGTTGGRREYSDHFNRGKEIFLAKLSGQA